VFRQSWLTSINKNIRFNFYDKKKRRVRPFFFCFLVFLIFLHMMFSRFYSSS